MTARRSRSWTTPVIQVVAAGFGTTVGGPLSCGLGGWRGPAVGESVASLVKRSADKFGDKAAEKLLDLGADSLVEKLRDSARIWRVLIVTLFA
jgi:hypothetical protein